MVTRSRMKKSGGRKKVSRLKREHSIRLWNKADGTWEVTHTAGSWSDKHLHDVEKDFKKFRKLEDAVAYMTILKKRMRGEVTEFDIDTFGYETVEGGWSSQPNTGSQTSRTKVKEVLQKVE